MENKKLTEEVAIKLSDNELVEYAKEGSEVATTTLLIKYKGMIRKVSRNYFITRGVDHEDFVQEASLAFIKAIQRYSPDKGSQFSTFAYQCMDNRLRDIVRSNHSLNNENFNNAQSITELNGKQSERIPGTHTPDPISQAIRNETIEKILFLAKEELSKKQYDVLMLFLEGYSYAEIQEKLNLANTKQVDNALSAAKRTLRDLLNV